MTLFQLMKHVKPKSVIRFGLNLAIEMRHITYRRQYNKTIHLY